jgi:hypothetical protein
MRAGTEQDGIHPNDAGYRLAYSARSFVGDNAVAEMRLGAHSLWRHDPRTFEGGSISGALADRRVIPNASADDHPLSETLRLGSLAPNERRWLV